MLRPAGGGIYTVSTGRARQAELQQRLYGVATSGEVEAAWINDLSTLSSARGAVLGIPSDVGAGLVRGAAYGPEELRRAWLALDARGPRGVPGLRDVGDVRVVPQLLHDEMLAPAQVQATRHALYPRDEVPAATASQLPVSPLSIAERVIDELLTCNPRLKLLVLGGDHSVAWPVVAALSRHVKEPWGIVHFDAHTDLLPSRLGIRHCFATWAFHALALLGDPARMLQIGIRASGRERGHWESQLGVRQLWAEEVRTRPIPETVARVVDHLARTGIEKVYISNDIDGTDALVAPATGTPEPAGLAPELVEAVIAAVGARFDILGADLVEVAPPVGDPDGAARTCALGARYLVASAAAML